MAGDEMYICERCREVVEADDPSVVRARTLIRADSLGDSQMIEGIGVHFHRRCWAPSAKYRLVGPDED